MDEPLGRDGIAEVWRGRDLMSDRPVTIKLLAPREAAPSHRRSRVRAAARIGHPVADRVLDVGEHEGRPFLVLEGDAVVGEQEASAETSQDQADPVLGAIPRIIPRALRAISLVTLIKGVMGILLVGVAVWMVTWSKPAAPVAAPKPSAVIAAPAPSAAPSVRPPVVPVPVIPSLAPTAPEPDRRGTGGIDGDVTRETNKKISQTGRKQGKGNSQEAPGRSRGLGKGQLKKR